MNNSLLGKSFMVVIFVTPANMKTIQTFWLPTNIYTVAPVCVNHQ